MTREYLADETSLRAMIDRWLEGADVIGPKATPWGDVLYGPLDSALECVLDFELQTSSPKEWLMPQVETLFTYRLGERTSVSEELDLSRRVIFGVRPCDTCGMKILSDSMGADPADPYFLAREEHTTYVVFACDRIFDGHFCHLTGTGPALEKGFDLQVTRLGGRFVIEVAGQRGASLMEGVLDLVKPAGDETRSALARARREAAESGSPGADLARVRERLRTRQVERALWETFRAGCRSCGGCSFVCPTCSCFSIVDVCETPVSGRRQRRWDSCAFPGFTRLARGRNPSAGGELRAERRLYHKIGDAVGGEEEAFACVGCGRCATVCLGGIDLPGLLAGLAEGGSA